MCNGYDSEGLGEYQGAKKSHSVTVNYGVRLKSTDELGVFVDSLAKELSERRSRYETPPAASVALSVILRYRHPEAPVATAKYMGLGWVEEVTASVTIEQCNWNDAKYLSKKIKDCIDNDARLKSIKVEDLRGATILIKETNAANEVESSEEDIQRDFVEDSSDSNSDRSTNDEDEAESLQDPPTSMPSLLRTIQVLRDMWVKPKGALNAFENSLKLIDALAENRRFNILSETIRFFEEYKEADLIREVFALIINYGKLKLKRECIAYQ